MFTPGIYYDGHGVKHDVGYNENPYDPNYPLICRLTTDTYTLGGKFLASEEDYDKDISDEYLKDYCTVYDDLIIKNHYDFYNLED